METIGQRIQRKMNEQKPKPWKRPQLKAKLKEKGLVITVESLRQYIKDETKPGRHVRRYLALAFNTTEEDIEFGTAPPQGIQEPPAPYIRTEHPEHRLLHAFKRLLPDQQQKYVEEIESLAATNMAMGQLVLREVKYNLNAENLPIAPALPERKKPGKPSKTK